MTQNPYFSDQIWSQKLDIYKYWSNNALFFKNSASLKVDPAFITLEKSHNSTFKDTLTFIASSPSLPQTKATQLHRVRKLALPHLQKRFCMANHKISASRQTLWLFGTVSETIKYGSPVKGEGRELPEVGLTQVGGGVEVAATPLKDWLLVPRWPTHRYERQVLEHLRWCQLELKSDQGQCNNDHHQTKDNIIIQPKTQCNNNQTKDTI